MEETKLPTVEIITTVSGWVVTFKAVIVTTEEQLEQVRLLRFAELIAFDTETSGLKVSLGARAIGYCLAAVTAENEITGYYIPVRHVNNDDTPQLSIEVVAPVVQEVLDGVSDDAFVALHHAKFDLAMARADGITIKRRIRDTMILATVANENETGFSLKRLASKYCCEGAETEEKALAAWMKKDARGLKLSYKKRSINKPDEPTYLERFGYARTPIDMCGFYGAKDVLYTLYLYAIHYRDVENQYPAVTEREHRVMRVLHEMEWTGLPADREEILRAHKACVVDLKYWIDEATRLANIMLDEIDPLNELITEFELSPQFLGALFYQKFGLASPKQTDSGADSTDKEARQLLAHRYPEYAPLIKAIDKAARVEKLASTYTDAFLRHYSEETGRIHPSYNQVERRDEGGVPVTGRLSCVAAWTEVLTIGGIKKIIDVRAGDFVWTHRGRWRLVLRAFSKGFEETFDVHFSNGAVLTCTADHRLLLASRTWLRVGAANERFEGLDARSQESRAGARYVPIERFVDGAADRGSFANDTPQCEVGFGKKDAGGRAQSALEAEVLRGKDGEQEPDEWQESRTASPLERRMLGRSRLFDSFTRGDATVCASGSRGESARVSQPAGQFRGASHRLGSAEQQSRQFSARDEERTFANSLFAGEGLPVVAIEEILYRGRLEVFDLTVEEDASYLACSVFSHNSGDPNIQNCAKKPAHLHDCRCLYCIAESLGKKASELDESELLLIGAANTISVRRYFTVPKGFIRLLVDFSQIELRVLAWFSRDARLLECYANDLDVHAITATEVTSGDRDIAKQVNFGNSYGMTEIGLAKRIADYYRDPEGTRKLAKQILINYFRTYCGIPRFRQEFARDMRANGNMFVNPFGRPRRLPDIGAWEQWRRERAERMMMSSIISGTAADIMKESMLRCDAVLQETSPESKIVQSIHDELVFDLRAQPGWANVAVAIVREMEDWPLFSDRGVPIRVACKLTTTDWEHLRELKVLPDGRLQLEN